MSDSEIPQENPERDQAADSAAEVPASGGPVEGAGPVQGGPVQSGGPVQGGQTVQGGQSFGPNATGADGAATGPAASTAAAGHSPAPAGLRRLLQGRRAVWAAVAAVCVVAGIVASILGAHAVARNDASDGSSAFNENSGSAAAALKLAIQREEELAVSTSTYFAGDPTATPKEFARWVKWARTLRRFPELDNLGLVAVVPKTQLPVVEARITGRALKPAATTTSAASAAHATSSTTSATATTAPPSTTSSGSTAAPSSATGATPRPAKAIRIAPASDHHYYCLATAELVRNPAQAPARGLDYCAQSDALLVARDQGLSRYTPVSLAGTPALAIETPVYRGNVTPRSVFGRGAASVGWLREVLVPGVVLGQVLRSYPGMAARLSYRAGSSSIAYSAGTVPSGARTATTSLHDGWTVTSFAPVASSAVFADWHSTALLIGGMLLSTLLGLLVFVLGAGRPPAPAPRVKAREVPNEDLYDVLTGLPNRALMLDRAECMLARAGRQSGLLVGALFIDIDWFKDVNDKLGQDAGDQLLANVAERLEGVVRAGDTVGRLGGDEFVILVESAARGARLDSLARRVIEALHKPFALEDFGPNFFMTASIGLAFGRYATPDDLLRDAQLALYAAKSAGKDRYTLFNANMRSVIEGRGVLEIELNNALQEKQFYLLYQPVYDLTTGKVAALEARIRWQHPKQGVLAPADFIPLAEETGLIVPIGRWMLEEACSRAAAWNVAGHRAGICVPVSSVQLNREGFLTDLRRALQQSGIEPSLLTLEVAETIVMSDVTAAVERLQEIKRLGVRIAIDDFGGSGYAYHSDLRRLPLDFLNVDRSSLAASDDEDYRTWLLEAILIVGRDLSLTVVAKGIETFEQLAALQTMGCTMAQGLFMGKPTPADALAGLFELDLPSARATSADALS
jgi:diguanylate cyclase (GGDEF)-like protein